MGLPKLYPCPLAKYFGFFLEAFPSYIILVNSFKLQEHCDKRQWFITGLRLLSPMSCMYCLWRCVTLEMIDIARDQVTTHLTDCHRCSQEKVLYHPVSRPGAKVLLMSPEPAPTNYLLVIVVKNKFFIFWFIMMDGQYATQCDSRLELITL